MSAKFFTHEIFGKPNQWNFHPLEIPSILYMPLFASKMCTQPWNHGIFIAWWSGYRHHRGHRAQLYEMLAILGQTKSWERHCSLAYYSCYFHLKLLCLNSPHSDFIVSKEAPSFKLGIVPVALNVEPITQHCLYYQQNIKLGTIHTAYRPSALMVTTSFLQAEFWAEQHPRLLEVAV